jgi:hypothetical protein
VSRKLSAVHTGRNSIGVDIDPEYCRMALLRLDAESGPLFGHAGIEYRKAADLMTSATAIAVADAPSSKAAHRRRARRLLTGSQLKTMTQNRREQSAWR